MLAAAGFVSGLVVNGPTAHRVVAAPRTSRLQMMPPPRLPGEGDPFNVQADGSTVMRRAEDIAVKQPRAISTGQGIPQYIENEDEPWHATCRPSASSTMATKDMLSKAFVSALPFVAAEMDLEDALVKCGDPDAVDKAIKAAVDAGARPGCPVIDGAEKLKKEMAKAAKDGKPMPKAKPRKDPNGAGKGWALQGEDRQIGKVHDNSV